MSGRESLKTGAYVAVRFPASHVVFHMLFDKLALTDKPDDAYKALSERVQASVREALGEMGVHVIETTAAAATFWCGQHSPPCETQCSRCAFEHPS